MQDYAFLRFHAGLPAADRAVLDAMAERLRSLTVGQGNAVMLKYLQRAMPALTLGECQALQAYTLAASGGQDHRAGGKDQSAGSSQDAGGQMFGPRSVAGQGSQSSLFDQTKQMQEMQMSFNLQYLQLQSQMQHENRSYTAVSNIMKTKHDTVKNSIDNIR